MNESTFSIIKNLALRLKNTQGCLYSRKFADIDIENMKTQEDFEALPFTDKSDLRDCYPLGLMSVPEEEIVRIHSSSGTTGTPVIIPYTRKDVADWTEMFRRCYEIAGITNRDRIHITPGYGLWTAGIGFQAGAEKLGAMTLPMGPGNTEKQIQFMTDMKSTVLGSTSSYALLLAEEIEKRGIADKIYLKKGIIGSERWGEKMRARIKSKLNIELYDIYGLTEIYGPGIGISCKYENGIHCFDDYMYLEIIDPVSGKNLPIGETGELVITTLQKEGAPLIRFRTHDITRLLPGECPCGCKYPRIDVITGRSDDLFKVKGVNMFPAQIEEVLQTLENASSEYRVEIDHINGKDSMTVLFECSEGFSDFENAEKEFCIKFKAKIGMTPKAKAFETGMLPRSEKKTKRIIDNRQ